MDVTSSQLLALGDEGQKLYADSPAFAERLSRSLRAGLAPALRAAAAGPDHGSLVADALTGDRGRAMAVSTNESAGTSGPKMTPEEAKARRISERVEEMAGPDFRYPTHAELDGHDCDLVMKGGITSGIVYPLAACELARQYRFRSIGGSSAGAIGAVMVAAAEHGRDAGGFRRLAEIPVKLGPKLGDMFTAGPSTKTALAVLKGWLQPGKPRRQRVGHIVRTLVGAQRRPFLVGLIGVLLLGVAGALVAAGLPSDAGDWLGLAAVGVVLILPVAVGAALSTATIAEVQSSRANLAAQGFGICVGSDGRDAHVSSAAEPGPFTDWMTAEIDRIAGVDGPLTIGDLRGPDPDNPEVQLQVMTTNLTFGRPQTFPFKQRTYLFDPKELEAYFPPKVINHLLADQPPATTRGGQPLLADGAAPSRPATTDAGTAHRRANLAGRLLNVAGNAVLRLIGWRVPTRTDPEGGDAPHPLYWLPPADDLPVVLAARLSLSFPGLISAVPLWSVDYTDDIGTVDEPIYRAKRCWMTDGGLTANFPVHFFDSPLPSRPTFAIDLQSYPDRYPDQDVYYPGPGQSGLQPRFKTITSVQGFAAGLLDTMQYWADNAQATLPGYRDRIVEVRLRSDEGGMNLQMPDDVVRRAAEKGRQAAELLRARFDFDDHRWLRYLTVTGRMQAAVDLMESRWDHELPGGAPSYHDFVLNRAAQQLFPRNQTWRTDAVTRTASLLSFATCAISKPDFLAEAPKPDPDLRITPRF
jgi:predicted acylesterase/phospholipase RssA